MGKDTTKEVKIADDTGAAEVPAAGGTQKEPTRAGAVETTSAAPLVVIENGVRRWKTPDGRMFKHYVQARNYIRRKDNGTTRNRI